MRLNITIITYDAKFSIMAFMVYRLIIRIPKSERHLLVSLRRLNSEMIIYCVTDRKI